jgi:transposase-like protein
MAPRLTPLERLARADRAATQAIAARRQATLDAYTAGESLRAIARTLGLTHEAVRRVVRQAGLTKAVDPSP